MDSGHATESGIGLIARNSSWLLLGNFAYGMCQWGVLVVLTKLGSAVGVGQFSLALAVTAPVLLFANLSLSSVIASDSGREYTLREYLGLRLVSICAALILITVISLLAWPGQTTALIVEVIGVMKALDAVSDVCFGLLQQRERMRRIGLGMLCNGIVSLVAVFTAMVLTRQVFWAAVGSALGSATALLFVNIRSIQWLAPRSRGWRPFFEVRRLAQLASLALPLGVFALLISLNANVPRYVIYRYLGEGSLGLFAAMAYVTFAGVTLIAALGQAFVPQMASRFRIGDIKGYLYLLGRLTAGAAALGFVVMLVAVLAGQQVLTVLYRREYAMEPAAFTWITAAASISFLASVLGYAMTAARRFRPQAPLAAATVVATGVACFWLVPRFGLIGAAWGMTIGAVVQFLGGLAVVRAAIRIRLRESNSS